MQTKHTRSTYIIICRYTYSDPTGFKLNFNYNAGTKVTPGYNYNQPLQGAAQNQQQPAYDDGQYREEPQDDGYRGLPGRTRPAYTTRNDLY